MKVELKSSDGTTKEITAERIAKHIPRESEGVEISRILDDGFRVSLGVLTTEDLTKITLDVAEYAAKNLGGEDLPEAEACVAAARERLVKMEPGVVPAFRAALHKYGVEADTTMTRRAAFAGNAATNSFFGVLGYHANGMATLACAAEAAGLADEERYYHLKNAEWERQSKYILSYLSQK